MRNIGLFGLGDDVMFFLNRIKISSRSYRFWKRELNSLEVIFGVLN